jgi:hypothetical protein
MTEPIVPHERRHDFRYVKAMSGCNTDYIMWIRHTLSRCCARARGKGRDHRRPGPRNVEERERERREAERRQTQRSNER